MTAPHPSDVHRRYARLTRDDWALRPGATLLRLPVRGYGYTLSSLVGRTCRHVPTCSEYMDEALARHGAWAGGWMGLLRLCRCGPLGSSGLDPVPHDLPSDARWSAPWRYGRRTRSAPRCEGVSDRAPETYAPEARAPEAMDGPRPPV